MSREPRIGLPGQSRGPTLLESRIDAAMSGVAAQRDAKVIREELVAQAVFALALPSIVELPDAEALELLRAVVRHDVLISVARHTARSVTLDFKRAELVGTGRPGVVIRTIEVVRPLAEVSR
jgi:hypothetical protein